MEYWEKLSIGVVMFAVGLGLLYWVIEKVLHLFQSSPHERLEKYGARRTFEDISLRTIRLVLNLINLNLILILIYYFRKQFNRKRAQRVSKEELDKLIYEEYKSESNNAVVVTAFDGDTIVGICAFLNQLQIEYYIESFKDCCINNCNNLSLR